ncbi:MAG TPA: SDR family NAD(P)-dependent oxidoreductase [Vicinamibacteria bacterium]|nr:SDR family NAD(P)-dependent oxidoreductase [Vicinamibacteria bacterium]
MTEPVRADLTGKTCLVTGANAGIGRAAARELARLGARVVLACRSREKGEAARGEIEGVTGNRDLEVVVADLSLRRSVRDLAQGIAKRHATLDVLVNNAGVWLERRQESAEGVEMTWATNVLGTFLLTDLLLPALEAAPAARVVNVASQLAGDLDLEDVEFKRRPYSGRAAYAQSKQAARMLTWALARRLDGTRVTANALHPGFVSTGLFAKAGGLVGIATSAAALLAARKPAEGADTVVWLAAAPEVQGRSGLFWIDRQERRCRFRDPKAEEALWTLLAGMAAA